MQCERERANERTAERPSTRPNTPGVDLTKYLPGRERDVGGVGFGAEDARVNVLRDERQRTQIADHEKHESRRHKTASPDAARQTATHNRQLVAMLFLLLYLSLLFVIFFLEARSSETLDRRTVLSSSYTRKQKRFGIMGIPQ